jgi:hypothetical protein
MAQFYFYQYTFIRNSEPSKFQGFRQHRRVLLTPGEALLKQVIRVAPIQGAGPAGPSPIHVLFFPFFLVFFCPKEHPLQKCQHCKGEANANPAGKDGSAEGGCFSAAATLQDLKSTSGGVTQKRRGQHLPPLYKVLL